MSRANRKKLWCRSAWHRGVVQIRGGPRLKVWPPRPDPVEVQPIRSPRSPSGALALALPLVLVLGSFANALAGETCEVPSSGSVSLIILSSSSKVHAYARTLKGAVARQDKKTVIMRDGRVITSDVEAAGRMLNEIGWGGRSVNVMASFPAARARPRRG